MTPAKMGDSEFDYGSWKNAFFMPKPCMLKYDGTVDYYLDSNDYSKKLDGTVSDVSNIDYPGNAMVEFPLIYYKMSSDDSGTADIYISNYKADDDYKCWANINAKNEIVPHFYMGIYTGFRDENGKLRSISGKHFLKDTSYNIEEIIKMAELNNTENNKLWNINLYCDYVIIALLSTLISKSLDTMNCFGYGRYTASSAKAILNHGVLNDRGLFFADMTNSINVPKNTPKKFFGMEKGSLFEYINGFYCIVTRITDGESKAYLEYKYKYKLTYGDVEDNSLNGYNFTGDGYIEAEQCLTEKSCDSLRKCDIGEYKYNNNGAFYPYKKLDSSSNIYKSIFISSGNYSDGVYPLSSYFNNFWQFSLFDKAIAGEYSASHPSSSYRITLTYETLSCKPNL